MIVNINENDAITYYLELHLLEGFKYYLTDTSLIKEKINTY